MSASIFDNQANPAKPCQTRVVFQSIKLDHFRLIRNVAMIRLVWIFCTLLFSIQAKSADRVDYERQVKPIFRQRCNACHGGLKQKAKLRLDTAKTILSGGDGGPAIVPGHADESLMMERLLETDKALRMPPEGSPLTPEQIQTLKTWINQGAESPKTEAPETDPLKHWAFQLPVRAQLPSVTATSSSQHPIDRLIDAQLATKGLARQPRAEPQVLIRRLYLDLTGLPPTHQELEAYLKNPSDQAYEQIVDQLLASPRHGERWARHWMDVWRYSDWYGRRSVPDVLNSYGQIWRWRDWIIQSLNQDRGYDTMVKAMLAADEISPENREEQVATGFLVRNFYRWNYSLWLKDNVEHTGKAFLAMTFNCAHCHDHKYDPIKNDDYFALRAVFEPMEIRHDRVPGEPDPGPYPTYDYGKAYKPITSGLVRVFDKNLDAKTFAYSKGESRNIIEGRPPIVPGFPDFLGGKPFSVKPVKLPREVGFPGIQAFIRLEEIQSREKALAEAENHWNATRLEAENLQKTSKSPPSPLITLRLKQDEAAKAAALADLASIHARIDADEAKLKAAGPEAQARALLAAQAEKWLAVQNAGLALARSELVHHQASLKSAAEAAKAAPKLAEAQKAYDLACADLKKLDSRQPAYSPLSPTYPDSSTGRRAALAGWIASPTNPLTARVAVNHIWRWHFGTPLVASTSDFGRNGSPPTNPDLLDWLAQELMHPSGAGAQPWSMKALHRLIVTSETYRMKSEPQSPTDPGLKLDPRNTLYWHFPRNRMEAEVVRDSLLHVAGMLDTTSGGPDIDLAQGLVSRRRSLYFTHHGESRMPFLEIFDAPDACDAYKRTTSVVPQQALAMVNNEFLLDLSQKLAEKLWAKTSAKPVENFLKASFETILARPPKSAELKLAQDFLIQQAHLIESESSGPSTAPKVALQSEALARRDLIHALFSHNDFLTIH